MCAVAQAAALPLPVTRVIVPHPVGGALELLVSAPPGAPRGGPGLLLAPPHPLLGGEADNRVLVALAEGALARGWTAVRFNYRGVGRSRAPGPELPLYERFAPLMEPGADLAPLVADARLALETARRWVRPLGAVGYSFGAAALAGLLAGAPQLGAVLVAPPWAQPELDRLGARPALVIAGEADALTPLPAPAELGRRFPGVRVHALPGQDHFFRGAEALVAEAALAYLAHLHEVSP